MKYRFRVLILLFLLSIITYIDRVCISFSLPFIRHDLNLSAVQMGWAFTAFGWAYALFEVTGGFLGDLLGHVGVIYTGIAQSLKAELAEVADFIDTVRADDVV